MRSDTNYIHLGWIQRNKVNAFRKEFVGTSDNIKVGRLTLAIESNEEVGASAVHINWEFLLLKYEVNKNEHNFHLGNNSEEKLFT